MHHTNTRIKPLLPRAQKKRMSAIQTVDGLGSAPDVAEIVLPCLSIGNRVRVRASEPGRAPKSAAVLRIVQQEGQPVQYEVLYDDESQATVVESQLCGSPVDIKPLIRVRKDVGTRVRGAQDSCGMLARTAEPEMQRLQVLSVVNQVTSDLSAVMGHQDRKTGKLSLEAAIAAASGGEEEVDEEAAAALELQLADAREASSLTTIAEMPPCDPTQALLDVLLKVGNSAGRMLPEDRMVAQRLVAAGMEMMMYGGSLMPDHLVDQLGHFVDITQERANRRMRPEPEEMAAWYKELAGPLQMLLRTLISSDMIESRLTPDGEILQARQEARPVFAMLRRFFEPSTTRSGVEDALRRCVNRSQRLRPAMRVSLTKPDLPSLPCSPQRLGSKELPQARGSQEFSSICDMSLLSNQCSPASRSNRPSSSLGSPLVAAMSRCKRPSSSSGSPQASATVSPFFGASRRDSLLVPDFSGASQRSASSSSRSGESFSPHGYTASTRRRSGLGSRSSSLVASGLRVMTPVR